MAGRADFTDAEWLALRKGVVGAGMLVSLSDRDFTDTFGEVGAMAKFLAGQEVAGSSPLVRDLAHDHGRPFGLTEPPDRLHSETMDALRTSVANLEQKSPDDMDGYRQLVLGVAGAVAGAKGGEKPVESEMIGQIRAALGA